MGGLSASRHRVTPGSAWQRSANVVVSASPVKRMGHTELKENTARHADLEPLGVAAAPSTKCTIWKDRIRITNQGARLLAEQNEVTKIHEEGASVDEGLQQERGSPLPLRTRMKNLLQHKKLTPGEAAAAPLRAANSFSRSASCLSTCCRLSCICCRSVGNRQRRYPAGFCVRGSKLCDSCHLAKSSICVFWKMTNFW